MVSPFGSINHPKLYTDPTARDQELRFTVHDSPDYHRLKVSVFNDDKKTELIGETWANLEAVITPGGGQADDWHSLTCKGKYAGEIRIELTYYDTRPKAEKPVAEKRKESIRPDGQSPAVGGPRESSPIKRRPLPTDPTGASPSPVNTPEHRGLRGMRAGPRELGSPRHQQQPPPEPTQPRPQQVETPSRRPVPEASPMNSAPVSSHPTPQRQATQDPYTPPNPRPSLTNAAQQNGDSFDMSYAAPKAYEVQPLNAVPQHVREPTHSRTMSQEDMRSSRGHSLPPAEPAHSHSAPVVPTQHGYENEPRQISYHQPYDDPRAHPPYAQEQFQDPAYQVAPLRPSRSHDRSPGLSPSEQYHSDSYNDGHPSYDAGSSHRRRSAMQPMVEDEDDLPPPPPVHRRNASTLPHPSQQSSHSYHDESPAPLNVSRYREEPQQTAYETPNPYASNDYGRQQPTERRYTHPRGPTHPSSRPESRDDMVPSPLRQETSALPSSLIAGHDASRDMVAYSAPPPSYETPPRLRQYSEPAEYRAITQYEAPSYSQAMVHRGSLPAYDAPYYPHDPPEQPRRTSPVHDPTPIVKPRATSPGVNPRYSPNPIDDRSSRGPARSMPTRKSVSPRPPMDNRDERRLSGVAFSPDSFDVYNPTVSKSPAPGIDEDERPGSRMEYNDKGQIVTFSGRVVDASDHLPIDNWAPEPTPKGTVKEKPIRARAQLNGSRDIEAARQREEKYRRDREAREHIRRSTSQVFGEPDEPSPTNALVTARHDFNNYNPQSYAGAMVLADQDPSPPGSGSRNRLQKRSPRPSYDAAPAYDSPTHSPMHDNRVLRERHNPNSYGTPPSYSSRHSNGPPIPAKIPLDRGAPVQNEDMALSLELQSIDIGPGSGGRRPRAQPRRQYGY